MNGHYMLIEVSTGGMMSSHKRISDPEKENWMANYMAHIKHELASILIIENLFASPLIQSSFCHFYYVPVPMDSMG
jgi:hypothetical protein